MSTYEKGGAKTCIHVHKHTYTRGVFSPRNIFVFRLSETVYGAFSGTVSLAFIKRFWEKLLSDDNFETGIERLIAAIANEGARFNKGWASTLPPPPQMNPR